MDKIQIIGVHCSIIVRNLMRFLINFGGLVNSVKITKIEKSPTLFNVWAPMEQKNIQITKFKCFQVVRAISQNIILIKNQNYPLKILY